MANNSNINFKEFGLEPIEEEVPAEATTPDFKSYGLSGVENKQPASGKNMDAEAVANLLKSMPTISNALDKGSEVARKIPHALGQIGEDLWGVAKVAPGVAVKAYGEIPQDVDFMKEAFPAAYNMIKENPAQAAKNFGAGAAEFAGKVSRIPPALVDYLAHIGMIKPETAQAMARPFSGEEVSQGMDKFVGDTSDKGGQLLRGAVRNADLVAGGTKLAFLLNPLKLTDKALAKEVVNTEKSQVAKHSGMYNNIWNEAEKTGFNKVPYDASLLEPYSELIRKFYPEKSTMVLRDFMQHPTLQNAQKAQSDLGNLRRQLEEKSRTTPLLETEKYLHQALSESEKNIESNMFKNAEGKINQPLQDKYKKVSKSYRENVVPYKYNTDIQAFKNREMLAKELIAKLKGGEFRAKKGSAHPRMAARELLKSIGLIGGGGVTGTMLYNLLNKTRDTGFSGTGGNMGGR